MYIVSKEIPTYIEVDPPEGDIPPAAPGRGGRGRGGPPTPPPDAVPDFVAYDAPYDFMM